MSDKPFFMVRLPAEFRERLRVTGFANRRSVSAEVAVAVQEYLERQEATERVRAIMGRAKG